MGGLLEIAESSGLTLQKIEELGLLSKAEQAGAIGILTNSGTPAALTFTSIATLAAAVALVVYVPDDTQTLIIAQSVGGFLLTGVSVATGVAGLIIGELQK